MDVLEVNVHRGPAKVSYLFPPHPANPHDDPTSLFAGICVTAMNLVAVYYSRRQARIQVRGRAWRTPYFRKGEDF